MTEEDVASTSKAEITLTLEPRFSPMEGSSSHDYIDTRPGRRE